MPGALASLKILDFSTLLPGPYATMVLADLGANVLRVEAPGRWDMVRSTPPFDGDQSAWHSLLARNKRSLALDMKQPGSAEIVQRLVQSYDIVVESFRPGVMDRLGIGYTALAAVNPAVIYCAITGYGQTGPYRDRAAHDLNLMALSGILQHTGRAASGPLPLGVQVADLGSAFTAIAGILAAVIQRQQTGAGQFVDVSMFDSALAWNALAASQYLVGGEEPEREAMLLNGGSFYDIYRTADDRFLSIASLEPKFWEGFCAIIVRPDLVARGYDPDPEAQRSCKTEIQAVIASRSLAEWQALFDAADVCVEPVLSVAEVAVHPQTVARGMVVDAPKADGGSQRQIGSPLRFSVSTTEVRHVGVELGQHTEEVLAELARE